MMSVLLLKVFSFSGLTLTSAGGAAGSGSASWYTISVTSSPFSLYVVLCTFFRAGPARPVPSQLPSLGIHAVKQPRCCTFHICLCQRPVWLWRVWVQSFSSTLQENAD